MTACMDRPRERTLEELAQELVDLTIGEELLRGQILRRMEDVGVERVDAKGGHVVYVKASSSTIVDVKAATELLHDLKQAVPMKPSMRRAGVRVNLR